MSVQVSFLWLVGLVLLWGGVKFFRTRSVPQYSPSEVSGRGGGHARMLLLDVRTERERAFQHIAGSLHIPLQQLRARAHELQDHRKREIVCYCQSGSRSLSAALILRKQGYRAASLRGGIVDWNFHHRPS